MSSHVAPRTWQTAAPNSHAQQSALPLMIAVAQHATHKRLGHLILRSSLQTFSSSILISTCLQSYLATWQSPALLAYISLTALPCILFSHLNTMSCILSACDVGTPPYVAITILKIFPLTAPHRPANQPRQPQCLPRLPTRIDGNALRSFCTTLLSANRLCPAVVFGGAPSASNRQPASLLRSSHQPPNARQRR